MAFVSGNNLTVNPNNVNLSFREEFNTFDTANTWSLSTGTNDIVTLDGNACGINYVVISKDPFTPGTDTVLTTNASFPIPLDLGVGLSMSQRVWGNECSIELISASDTPYSSIPDIAISSISQTTTVLTITTASAHGLSAGSRISIYGVTGDSRLNFPSLVVATVISPTTILVTGGPQGTITSITTGPFTNQGYISYRPALSYTKEGCGMVFENTTATNASYYATSQTLEPTPSGSFSGNHAATTGTTASIQPAINAYAYTFLPTNEYKIHLQPEKLQYYYVGADSTGVGNGMVTRTNLLPDPSKKYNLRIKATNTKGVMIPVAKVVSSVKTGTTTATITTDVNHGLTTGDYVFVYGNNDQTNFANLTTASVVLSTPTSNTFTVVYGTAVTATTYGGMVIRQNGSASAQAGWTTIAVQSISSTTTELTLIGSGNWAWLIGDYVNVYGVRNTSTGADMSVDGVYKVVNVSTTTLVLKPIGSTVLPAPISSTNCGGTVIKRTDVRISYVRAMQFNKERIEVLNKNDPGGSLPVIFNTNSSLATVSTVTTVSTVSVAYLGLNQLVTDITSAALTATATSATITPAAGSISQEFNIIVTAVSGTSPTMDVVVQESDDSGTNWYDVYHFPRITATGQYRSPLIPLSGNRIRYVRTVGGTTPSFTNAVNRLQSHISCSIKRQFYNTSLAVNTVNSTTSTYFIDGCTNINCVVSMGAVTTTAPVLVVEYSIDGSQWYQSGADITTVASTNQIQKELGILARFVRVRVKTAGSGATLNYIMIKGSE